MRMKSLQPGWISVDAVLPHSRVFDPKLLETYEKLGIPLRERGRLAGVAVDAVFDSVSVGTTFKKQLGEKGIIFCSFTEAVQEHPDLVKKYLGTVVPCSDSCRLRTASRTQ